MVVVNQPSPIRLQTTKTKFIGEKSIEIERERVGKQKEIGRIEKGTKRAMEDECEQIYCVCVCLYVCMCVCVCQSF